MENFLLLRKVPLFSSLRLAELRRISEKIETRHFTKGEVICEEGKPSAQTLYVVAAGQLNILLRDKILTTISVANYFGEFSLLSGESHSATVKAVGDGKLLVIKKNLFEEIIKKHPEVILWLSKVLGKKLRQTINFSYKDKETSRVFCVLSNEKATGKSVLSSNLAASYLRQTGKRVLLVDFYSSPGSSISLLKLRTPFAFSSLLKKGKRMALSNIQRCVVKHPSGLEALAFYKRGDNIQLSKKKLARFFMLLKKVYEMVIVDVPSGLNSEQMKVFMEESDGVIFLVKENPFAVHSWQRFLNQLKPQIPNLDAKLKTGVLLEGSSPQAKLPLSCRFVLPCNKKAVKTFTTNGKPFVNSSSKSDLGLAIDRFAREIGNLRVGLALSAGMASGLAHIGVLKVLQRENIPIDLVAGTSGGALYGSPFAAGVPLTRVIKEAQKIGRLKMLLLLDFTLPYAGFIRGEKIVNFVKSFIGDRKFVDLSIPFKVIATDFYTGEVFIIERGLVLNALRASIAVPGIITPFKYEGRFLVDGATVSPLPVDILYKSGVDKVIAINACVTPATSNKKKEKAAFQRGFPPHFFDVITHSRAITSHRLAEIESRKADITIFPDTTPYHWRDYHLGAHIIEAGEKAAEEALPKIRSLFKLET